MISVGRWVMLTLGVLALLGAIWMALKAKGSLLMWVFGVLLLGMGSFGMEFIPKYSDWLGKLSDMIKNPGKESYGAFFASVGKQTLTPDIQQIGIDYAINHPIEGMESLLKGMIDQTPENTGGRKALDWAMENFQGKRRVIDQILESKPRSEVVRSLDRATAEQVFDELRKLTPERLRLLDIPPGSINSYEPSIQRFPIRTSR
jgi:hypothetical protein